MMRAVSNLGSCRLKPFSSITQPLAAYERGLNPRTQFLTMRTDEDHFFSFSMTFHGREFLITFFRDGVSHWEDLTLKQKLAGKENFEDFARGLFGDASAARRYSDRIGEFTVTAELTRECMSFVEIAAELFRSDRWTIEHEKRLDDVLTPFFWSHINPQLSVPVEKKRPTSRHSQ